MKTSPLYPNPLVLLVAASLLLTGSVDAEIPNDVRSAVEAMSTKLAGASSIRLEAKREISKNLAFEKNQPEEVSVEVVVERPNQLRAIASAEGFPGRHFYFDGKQVALHDIGEKIYASVDVDGDIDKMIDTLEGIYGFVPPIGELFVSDLAKSLLAGEQDAELVETKEGNRHFRFTSEAVHWEIWIGEDDLPTKFSLKFVAEKGKPSLTVSEMKWDLDADFESDAFTFSPPEDAEKIEMLTEEEIKQTSSE